MNYEEFLENTRLPEKLKTFTVWLEWIGYFDYYYYREKYGEGDCMNYADQMILALYQKIE